MCSNIITMLAARCYRRVLIGPHLLTGLPAEGMAGRAQKLLPG